MLGAKFPRVELIEASSEVGVVHAVTKAIERMRPVGARLVRVHDRLWLRMMLRPLVGALPAGVIALILIGGMLYSLGSFIHTRTAWPFHNAHFARVATWCAHAATCVAMGMW